MNRTKKPLRQAVRRESLFFTDPAEDALLAMVLTLGAEVWALRERLAAMESIAVRQGALSPGELDEYEFDPRQQAKLAAQRKAFLESLFQALQQRRSEDPAVPRSRRSGIKRKGRRILRKAAVRRTR